MVAGGQRRTSETKKADDQRSGEPQQKRSTSAGDRPARRGFGRPGRTQVERIKDLPVERQIRALLKNPTPSPAEQNRLCELTRTKSYRAAVGVAKRMLVPPATDVAPVGDDLPSPRGRSKR